METHRNGTLVERPLSGIRLQYKHLVAALGEAFPVSNLALSDLQAYVDRRARAKDLRSRLSRATNRTEIVTLRTTRNWGVKMGLVAGKFPNGA